MERDELYNLISDELDNWTTTKWTDQHYDGVNAEEFINSLTIRLENLVSQVTSKNKEENGKNGRRDGKRRL